MRLFGTLKELVAAWLKQDGYDIKITPSSGTTYTAARTFELPAGDSDDEIVGKVSTQTLTNKRLTSPKINEDVALTSTATELNQLDDVSVGGNTSGDILTTDDTQTVTGKSIVATQIDSGTLPDARIQSSGVTQHEADIDHNNLTNTHDLTTDIDHDAITNTHNLTTDIDHDSITNTHDLTTDIDHNTITNNHNLTTDIDHDGLTNTHNLSTDIDHNGLTNTHNLTTDIDHDSLTNTHDLTTDIDHDAITNGSNTSGVHGVTGDVVGTSDTQALTAKDIDGGTASDTSRITVPKNTTSNLAGLSNKEATVAYDTDKANLVFNDGSAWQEVGSGSGGGSGINYIDNGDAEGGATTGWDSYDDGAVDTPVDGTGSSASNLTLSAQDTTVLRGAFSFKLAKDAADAQGEGVSYDFAIDDADLSKRLSISFDWQTDTTYESDDIGVWIYDVDNSALISPSSINLPGTGATTTPIQIYFNATDSSNYRLMFHVRTTEASAYDVYFDNVKVGPQDVVQATPISDWTSFTPTSSITTNVVHTGFWRRVGDEMEVRIKSAFSGASDTASVTYTIPLGLTIDTSKLSSDTERVLGIHNIWDGSIGYPGWILYETTQTVAAVFFSNPATTTVSSNVSVNYGAGNPNGMSSGDYATCSFKVPIAEWASSSVGLSNSRVEYVSNSDTSNANDTTSFVYGPSGVLADFSFTAARTKRVRFLTPIQPTDVIKLEFSEDKTVWQQLPFDTSTGTSFLDWVPASSIGAFYTLVAGSSTDVDVKFGRYRSGTSAWNSSTDVYWRVSKSSNPISVGTSVNNDLDPLLMDRESATRMGNKCYLADISGGTNDIAYNEGNKATITGGDVSAVSDCYLYPKQNSDGDWLLEFSLNVSNTSTVTLAIGITGVLTKGSSIFAVSADLANGTKRAYMSGATITLTSAGAANTSARITGSVPLNAKPTWAY